MLPRELVRLDTHAISEDKSEIRLFGVMKDESLRLPYFLDCYRRAGVRQFFIVDNDPTDGMTEFLLQQPDCCVFHTKDSYARSRACVMLRPKPLRALCLQTRELRYTWPQIGRKASPSRL